MDESGGSGIFRHAEARSRGEYYHFLCASASPREEYYPFLRASASPREEYYYFLRASASPRELICARFLAALAFLFFAVTAFARPPDQPDKAAARADPGQACMPQ